MYNPELPEPISFEWDTGNQTKSLKKHGITNLEAEETFSHFKLVALDQRHSTDKEGRLGMYGQTDKGKILFLAFTIRTGHIRIISVRPADKKERKLYEEAFKKAA